jgi:two-component system, NarL family, sensor kinase
VRDTVYIPCVEMLREHPVATGEAKDKGSSRSLRVPIALSVAGSLLAFLAIGLGLLWATNGTAERQAVNEAGSAGELAARVALAPFLTPGLIERNEADIDAVDAAGRTFKDISDVVRLKVWSEQQQVLWSDERILDGQFFELEPEEFELFETGLSAIAVSDLSKEENFAEVADGNDKLLEVYFGAKTTDGQAVLVESYFDYAMVTQRESELRRSFMPLVILGLGLLTLAQVPLAILLARRLNRAQRERERLLERVITASDAERRRIAAEVHDGAVQDLIGISYSLEANADTAPAPINDTLHELAGSTRTTVRRLRSILNSIYPVEVPPEGWSNGFNDLIQALESNGVSVELDVAQVPLAPMDAMLLLRVTRESLRNVAAHAEADHVVVKLHPSRMGKLTLEVRDDGKGFTADKANSSRSAGHLGLQLLHDLADDVGANLTIDSTPGQGTSIRLELMGQR